MSINALLHELARAVINNWEGSGLAPAVNALRERLDELDADRAAHTADVARAIELHASDDLEFDADPNVAPGTGGVWVSAWVWVPEPEDTKEIRVCQHCGSPQLTCDASERINTGEVSTFDDIQCQGCGAEGHSVAIEVQVPADFDVDDDLYDFETQTTKVKE